MSPTVAPLAIVSVIAPIAALDVLYYHIYKFRLYSHRASQLETVTHLARGLLFAAIVFVLARYEPRGAWVWMLTGLAAIDFANNIVDVLLEPKSRAALGGIPPLEYLVHVVGATGSGLVAGAWVIGSWHLTELPTELASPQGMPAWLGTNGHVLYVSAVLMFVGEATLLIRARLRMRGAALAA